MAKWRGAGWEFVGRGQGPSGSHLTFRKETTGRWVMPTRLGWVAMVLVATLMIALTGVLTYRDHLGGVRADARAAIRALKAGDLVTLDQRLVANRGQPDFAYFFASQATPRDLGDALATVAGPSEDEPFKAGVDTHAYDLVLTDLAGTLALATHGVGDRSLPAAWTSDFILATTTPVALYGEPDGFFDKEGKRREKQDRANKANLLLLLARGYWSSDFLKAVTKGYYDFDLREGDDAWPNANPADDVGYAPAPSGTYLTDGVLALTAALTANSTASEWAFTDFQPGTVEIEGSDYAVGRFTHYLLFEHRFPEAADDATVGMTAALTALSSAINSRHWAEGTPIAVSAEASSTDVGPMHDASVLRDLAYDIAKKSGCSLNPLDYGQCVIAAATAVWRWVRHWGHLVLDILTLTTFAPPPFNAVGVAAAATNASWYAIEGDFGMAGLSLAAAVPGLAAGKIAKGSAIARGATAAKAEKAATKSDDVAKAAKWWRPMKPWKDCDLVPQGGLRLKYDPGWTAAQRHAADEKMKAIYEAAEKGTLRKTLVVREGTAKSTYVKATGKTVPAGHDVDHTIELQLGGMDDVTNMRPLDSAVNRSIGIQIYHQISNLDYGAPILGAAIC